MSIKNPFKVLGFDPDILRNLSEQEIEELVKSQYRRLQAIYHPDKPKGSEEKSKIFTEAYEMLDRSKEPEVFEELKKQFLKKKPLKEKILNLEDELQRERIFNQESLSEYKKIINEYFSDIAGFNEALTVFNIGACSLKMYDYGKTINRSTFTNEHGGFLNVIEERRREAKDVFYELIIDEYGVISKKLGEKKIDHPLKKLIGAIPERKVIENVSMMNIIKMTQYINTPEDVATRKELRTTKEHIPTKYSYYDERLTPNAFANIVHFITPKLSRQSYLFSINLDRNSIYYSLEGKILQIER